MLGVKLLLADEMLERAGVEALILQWVHRKTEQTPVSASTLMEALAYWVE